MPKYTVPMFTYANIAVTVDVPEGVTDPQVIADLALGEINVSLCHQCAGHRNDSLDIGDEWNYVPTSDTDPAPQVTKESD